MTFPPKGAKLPQSNKTHREKTSCKRVSSLIYIPLSRKVDIQKLLTENGTEKREIVISDPFIYGENEKIGEK